VAEVKEKKREMETMNKTPHGIFTRHEKKTDSNPCRTPSRHKNREKVEKNQITTSR
jgi:hypothetical protein